MPKNIEDQLAHPLVEQARANLQGAAAIAANGVADGAVHLTDADETSAAVRTLLREHSGPDNARHEAARVVARLLCRSDQLPHLYVADRDLPPPSELLLVTHTTTIIPRDADPTSTTEVVLAHVRAER